MNQAPVELRENFLTDGYAVLKGAFSAEEINKFRKLVYEQHAEDERNGLAFTLSKSSSKARYAKGDLLSKKRLREILLDDRILGFARRVLGSDRLIYFGDSSYQIGTGLRGFHRDSIDRTDLSGPDWKSEYTLIRVGLYLQNHKQYSGGLQIKPGSHLRADGPKKFLDSETGDLAAWSLKLLHSGNAVKLKWLPNMPLDPALENRIPSFLRMEQEQERVSLFMTFAVASSHIDRYIQEYEMKREDASSHIKASRYTKEAIDAASGKGVEVLVIYPEHQLTA
jgi:hypothetical protein